MEREYRNFLLSQGYADRSVSNYVSGIESIERKYSIDIDSAYVNGELDSLKETIKADVSLRKDQIDDWPSFINEYIKFKNPEKRLTRYWMFSSGTNADHWESDYNNKRMSGNWPIRSLTEFNSINEIKQEYGPRSKEPGIVMDFKKVKPGDYVISRSGNKKILGLGVVVSDYEYDERANNYRHYYNVKWLIKREYDYNIRQKGQVKPTIYEISQNELRRIAELNEEFKSYIDKPDDYHILFEQKNTDNKDLCDISSNNIILYGPPGTGKTYNTIIYAVRICEPNFRSDKIAEKDQYEDYLKEYKKLKKEGRIQFTTFHQSYGYEEFIEGIKPMVNDTAGDENSTINYKIENGVFKSFCDDARFSLAWDKLVKLAVEQGELTVKLKTKDRKLEWNKEKERFDVKDEGLEYEYITKEMVNIQNKGKYTRKDNSGTDGVRYYTTIAIIDFMIKNDLFCIKKDDCSKTPFVFIIDEINRGNISKIFGELITLIEDSKRAGNREAMSVELPYSGNDFSVPNNVFILGTMNTADRSIAMLDTALRRRFQFIEMKSKPERLNSITKDKYGKDLENSIDLRKMLETINERIEVLYDREHTIGHAYFINVNTFDELKDVFQYKIIPLLQEYFYDDYEKIRLVLGDNQKEKDEYSFVIERKNEALFGKNNDYNDEKCYMINGNSFSEIKSYTGIYKSSKINSEVTADNNSITTPE